MRPIFRPRAFLHRRFASTSTPSPQNPQVQKAMESAQRMYQQSADAVKRVAGPTGERMSNAMGGYGDSLVFNFRTFTSLLRQVYQKEGLAPPLDLSTWTHAYGQIWTNATNFRFWRDTLRSGAWATLAVGPTIAVNRKDLWRRLKREYSEEEFDELLFEYGLEYDGIDPLDSTKARVEVAANRPDLLCIEGLARALRTFLQLDTAPHYTLSVPSIMQEVHVESSTSPLRPFFAACVLRLARPMSELEYESFIALQDHLHRNVCRQRRFVAIGTHDLDTIEGPFRYMCKDPKKIKFAPLNRDTEHTAEELMTIYESDRHLKPYLPIIRDSAAFPIIYDSKDRVLSMPPIINSQRKSQSVNRMEHSKIIAGKTRNIFVDTTATDQTKLDVVINIVATMFAEYCQIPFSIEPVRIHMPNGTSHITPPIAPRATTASQSYINAATGLQLSREEACTLLTRMSLSAKPSSTDPDALDVEIPCTRPDIFHEADVMEDAAIAYGFNNLPQQMPKTNTVAKPFAVNRLADIIRRECAMAGWTEALPLILCSHDENFAWLRRPDPGKYAITLANPASIEYQIVRTSLLPGLLKTARENRSLPLPMKIFEVSDVAIQDHSAERQARNYRRVSALYMDRKAGFEVVHGLLDRVFQVLGIPFLTNASNSGDYGYYISSADDPTYLAGRGAKVYYRPPSTHKTAKPTPQSSNEPLHSLAEDLKEVLPTISSAGSRDMVIGSLGILHPKVIANFDISRPCSSFEVDIEPLL